MNMYKMAFMKHAPHVEYLFLVYLIHYTSCDVVNVFHLMVAVGNMYLANIHFCRNVIACLLFNVSLKCKVYFVSLLVLLPVQDKMYI